MLVLFLPLFLSVVEALLKPNLKFTFAIASRKGNTDRELLRHGLGSDLQPASQQPKITVALLGQNKQILIVTQSSGSNNSKFLRKGLSQYVYATAIVVNFFPNVARISHSRLINMRLN
ncbi:hypothetical protein BELL_0038g00060 [Botrytis elliptica]|uniref:Uncharacterized protein n=1 Tax=Botrytis elliptica TaxID=278938 RepID=A0A4Z1KDL2_9HELO|nr:hypothetical protein BELL_0038g00060 [Botrytis elliptica]